MTESVLRLFSAFFKKQWALGIFLFFFLQVWRNNFYKMTSLLYYTIYDKLGFSNFNWIRHTMQLTKWSIYKFLFNRNSSISIRSNQISSISKDQEFPSRPLIMEGEWLQKCERLFWWASRKVQTVRLRNLVRQCPEGFFAFFQLVPYLKCTTWWFQPSV